MAQKPSKLEKALNLKKYPAKKKQYKESVVFIHFFDGSPMLIQRHIDFVNELGFDAYAYQVSFHLMKRRLKDFIPERKRLGLKNLWTKDLERVLKEVRGDKILYAFSNPAGAAIEVTAKHYLKKKNDIKALICDSGPFYDLIRCSNNLVENYYNVKSSLLRFPSSVGMSLLLAPLHETYLYRDLQTLPKDFPILSIRGWKDKLVPPRSIEKVFDPHDHIDLQVLNMPEAGHLNGLKDFADIYEPMVSNFLSSYAKPLSDSTDATK